MSVTEVFEELNYPSLGVLKKALKQRGIPFNNKQVEELVKEAMQNAMPGLDVPLQADLGWGRHWLEAH